MEALMAMYESNMKRAVAITIMMIVIIAALLWVSYYDMKRKKVTFWKMLVASSTTILLPLLISFFYNCSGLKGLRWYIMAALPLWVILLYLNVKHNKDKFMGKADVDLLSALFAEGVTFSLWLYQSVGSAAAGAAIAHFWYSVVFYLMVGSITYLLLASIYVMIRVTVKHESVREYLKNRKVSMIPMFIPVSVMLPYMVMVS